MPGVKFDGISDTERMRCVVDLAAIFHLGPSASALVEEASQTGSWRKIQQALRDVYVDVSQNPVRQPWLQGCTCSCVSCFLQKMLHARYIPDS